MDALPLPSQAVCYGKSGKYFMLMTEYYAALTIETQTQNGMWNQMNAK